ncbi:MAG TPA: DUF262 domain-containing HNH endonuclease family protein [Candidatus Stackebrandtia faecavium]|nr:DUF262 domain-containing HNH endonuclease family protein [Candidatus Stackebrandtia faecavium]
MEASQILVTGLLKREDTQYQIPLYQRPYSWNDQQCEDLWRDVQEQADRKEEGGSHAPHFLGAIVLTPALNDQASFRRFLVVDGQQRLTTLSLALAALRDHCQARDPERADRIEKQYLVNGYKSDDDRLRVLPTQVDRHVYRRIIIHRDVLDQQDRIIKAYHYFKEQFAKNECSDDPIPIEDIEETITTRLSLVDVTADKNENAHRIFESLNNKGQGLLQADLIRNHVFMMLGSRADDVYDKDWKRVAAEAPDANDLEAIMWLKLVLDGDRDARRNDLYGAQQRWFERHGDTPESAVEYIRSLARLAPLYRLIREPDLEQSLEVRDGLKRLETWKAGAAHPVVMVLLDARSRDEISSSEVARGLVLIESFLVRRTFVSKTPSGLVRIFQSIPAQLAGREQQNPVDCIHKLLSLSRRNWPNDAQLRKAMRSQPFFEKGGKANEQRRFILSRIEESYGHPEPIDFATGKLTIEHVMPQSLTDEWRELLEDVESDESARETHQRLVHTIGNLTLSAENSKLGTKIFERKKVLFESSHLEMNREIANTNSWGENEILSRADRLADRAIKLWPAPIEDSEVV